MIRGVLFFIILGFVVYAAVWVADRPGDVTVTWQGYRLDTSVGVVVLLALVLAALSALVYRFWWVLRRGPGVLLRLRRERRRRKGYHALTQGMVAVAAGDPDEARSQARRADVLLSDPPLTMLLSAQAAQLTGEADAARKYFTAMLEQSETEFLGVRGLLVQATRDGDVAEALDMARRAYRLRPKAPWVRSTLFDLETRAGEWQRAEALLDGIAKKEGLSREARERRRAIILYERSCAAAGGGGAKEALRLARQAHEADAGFVPAAHRLAALQLAAGKPSAAARTVEETWRLSPQAGLARLYGEIFAAEDAVKRVQRVDRLANGNPGHRESHLAQARAAIDARLWGAARSHLEAVTNGTLARACRMMAEVEERENDDTGAARAWLARAAEAEPDPAWVCGQCGTALAEWRTICPNCAAFARFAWQSPARVAPDEIAPPEAEAAAALPAAEGEAAALAAPEGQAASPAPRE